MFDLGIQELIVIFVVALLVFGPKKLPEIGRTLGRGMNELKRAMQGVKEQMDTEMHSITETEGLKELKDLKESMNLSNIITPEQQNAGYKEPSEDSSEIEHTAAELDESLAEDNTYAESTDFATGYGDQEIEETAETDKDTAQANNPKTETKNNDKQQKSSKGAEGAA